MPLRRSELLLIGVIFVVVFLFSILTYRLRVAGIHQGLCAFDCNWYCAVSERGYEIQSEADRGRLAFFPIFPAILAALRSMTHGSCATLAPWISALSGAIGFSFFWIYSKRQGLGATAPFLIAFGPASIHMLAGYPEGILIPLILILLAMSTSKLEASQRVSRVALVVSSLISAMKPDGALLPSLMGAFRLIPRTVLPVSIGTFLLVMIGITRFERPIFDYLHIQLHWMGSSRSTDLFAFLASNASIYLVAMLLMCWDIVRKGGAREKKMMLVGALSCLVLILLDSRQGFYSLSRHLLTAWQVFVFAWALAPFRSRWVGAGGVVLSALATLINWQSLIQGSAFMDY